jgi:hypothetical protein
MIKIIENFTTKFHQADLQDEILSEKFEWTFRDYTSGGECPNFAWIHDANTEDCHQLVHVTSGKSAINSLMGPLIYNIAETVGYNVQIQRIKINLMTPNPFRQNPNSYNRPHVDHSRPDAMTAIYYVNDSDGDTIIFGNDYTGNDPGDLKIIERITPKAGTLILFPSKLYHASSSPTSGKRSVINFIFWPAVKVDPTDPFGPIPIPPHLQGLMNP